MCKRLYCHCMNFFSLFTPSCWSRDGAVDEKFGSGGVRCWCADVAWIIDKIATDCEAGSFWFCFLWTIVDTDSSVGYILAPVLWNFVVIDEEDGLGSFDASADSLCEASKFVG